MKVIVHQEEKSAGDTLALKNAGYMGEKLLPLGPQGAGVLMTVPATHHEA